jgi:hypothetical protein
MVRSLLSSCTLAALAVALLGASATAQQPGYVGAYGAVWSGPRTGGIHGDGVGCLMPGVEPEDLFYNYYTAANCGAIPAALYPAPKPVPPIAGHVYYTYQPFLPHEHLYTHHRSYHRYYDGGRGLSRTHASWHPPYVHTAAWSVRHHLFEIPR